MSIARCVCIRCFPKVCVGLVLGHTIFYFIFSAVKCVGGGREQRCWMLNIVFRAPNIRSERQVLVAPAPAVTIWQWSNTRRLQSSPPAPSVSHSSGSDTERREERGEVSRNSERKRPLMTLCRIWLKSLLNPRGWLWKSLNVKMSNSYIAWSVSDK